MTWDVTDLLHAVDRLHMKSPPTILVDFSVDKAPVRRAVCFCLAVVTLSLQGVFEINQDGV